jgi:hypothetical protein
MPSPVRDLYARELEELAARANITTTKKIVTLQRMMDPEETMLHHIRRSANWLVQNGPAPRTLYERKASPLDTNNILYLLFLQVTFFGDISLTPWQFTFYTELCGFLDKFRSLPVM